MERTKGPFRSLNSQPSWRNAVDSHHTPVSKSALVSTEARLARPVDIPNWSAAVLRPRYPLLRFARTRPSLLRARLTFQPKLVNMRPYALDLLRMRRGSRSEDSHG